MCLSSPALCCCRSMRTICCAVVLTLTSGTNCQLASGWASGIFMLRIFSTRGFRFLRSTSSAASRTVWTRSAPRSAAPSLPPSDPLRSTRHIAYRSFRQRCPQDALLSPSSTSVTCSLDTPLKAGNSFKGMACASFVASMSALERLGGRMLPIILRKTWTVLKPMLLNLGTWLSAWIDLGLRTGSGRRLSLSPTCLVILCSALFALGCRITWSLVILNMGSIRNSRALCGVWHYGNQRSSY